MSSVNDPLLCSEDSFQSAVIAHIQARFNARPDSEFHCHFIKSFGLDECAFIKTQSGTTLRLLEFKAYRKSNNRIGFGNGKGIGPQVDLLMLPDDILDGLNETILWCVVDLDKPQGTDRFSTISSDLAKKAASGIVSRGKQNNLRPSGVLSETMDWSQLLDAVESFQISK